MNIEIEVVAAIQMLFGILALVAIILPSFRNKRWEKLPNGYKSHIYSFVPADVAFTGFCVIGGLLIIQGNELGVPVSLLASGMLVCFSLTDITYNLRESAYSRNVLGLPQVFTDFYTGTMATFFSVYYLSLNIP